MHDEFGQQRIKGRARRIAATRGSVDADAEAGSRFEARDAAARRARRAVLAQDFRIDTDLHRVAARRSRRSIHAELRQTRAIGHL